LRLADRADALAKTGHAGLGTNEVIDSLGALEFNRDK
jgi:hypothetical protein